MLLFEFRPACVQRVYRFLRFVQLAAGVMETNPIAGDDRVLKRGALGFKKLLRFVDAVFDACELPGFVIRKFLF